MAGDIPSICLAFNSPSMHKHFSCQVWVQILHDSLHGRGECSKAVKKIRNKNPTELDKNVHNIFLMVLLVMSHSQMWSWRREAKIKSKTKLFTGNQFESVAMQVKHWAPRPFPTVRRHCLYLDPLCWTRFWNTFDRDKKLPLFGITKSPAFLNFNQPHTSQLPGWT